MQSYRKIDAWHRAHRFYIQVERLATTFPRGNARFIEQLTGSAESVPTNIVEGAGAATRKEFARFLDISIKSCCECQYQLESARDRGLLPNHRWIRFDREIEAIRRMIFGFRRALLTAEQRDQAIRQRKTKRLKTDN